MLWSKPERESLRITPEKPKDLCLHKRRGYWFHTLIYGGMGYPEKEEN
jgi:hypothetical protein